ncbi:ABC-type nitrate/sulfonate/bicarbonate transport system, permease component [Seinonella peptonophila]|uniref:ABC-type nitrate/sulfonate/bicarbonate transport system, permease component n=1 Tax=Seinonella peptonophila TaxID=112248 RepID=A0A1M5AKH5_9BACL|nr:ABC transporter permease [Seinonella peptonophila]SHF30778.1 ABC-type nitrate/sulfonate/bicarbonate transport system, permease component [Seinonella peptonophila]
MNKIRLWFQHWFPAIGLLALLFIIWEGAVRFYQIEKWVLPAPSQILLLLGQQQLAADIYATTKIALIGLLIGIAVGYLFALLSQLVPWIKRAIYPLLLLSQNIPMIALAPLLIAWFGFGDLPKLIVVTLVCFFPITIAVLDGFTQTDHALWTYLKISGASRWQIFWHLEAPATLPHFFSGCKLAATYSVMGAIIAEWLGAEQGLGQVMKVASSSFEVGKVFVAIIWVVLLSLLFFGVFHLLERVVIRWKPSRRGGR